MKPLPQRLSFVFAVALFSVLLAAQESTQLASIVPRLVSYSGHVADKNGQSPAGVIGITFAIYKEEGGGAPLWLETQNVQVDAKGNYTVELGSTKSEGLPLDLFNSKESRWLGAQVSGQEEQRRILLLSVPYALKAADSEALGGLPASAFVLAAPANGSPSAPGGAMPASSTFQSFSVPAVTGSGAANYLPLWTDNSGTLGNSALFQSGSGSTAKVGINIAASLATLEVQGTEMVHGQFTIPSVGLATGSAGKKSYPIDLRASAYSSSTSTAVSQNFQWVAEPVGNNTGRPSASLNLLFGQGTSVPADTGFTIASNGQITFAAGQTFPGAGTVTSVGLSAPTSDFTVSGSSITGSGTLGLRWKLAPTDAATPSAIVRRDSAGGFSSGPISASNSNGLPAISVNENSGNTNVSALSAASASGIGVEGTGNTGVLASGNTYGVFADGLAYGVFGRSPGYYGVYGEGDAGGTGVYGVGFLGTGVVGISTGGNGTSGVYAQAEPSGSALNAYNTGGGTAVLAGSNGGFAGWFNGNVQIDGNLSNQSGSFKIDHPLDPANKYLSHAFVESPDMMNIYNGNVTTDGKGDAVVDLPQWFETLNRDFRYQLTVIGQFAQAIVSSEIAEGRFVIKTDKPNVKVSWQVTGIRQDAWANAHRIPIEEVKPEPERGSYLHPELYGAPEEKSVLWARSPQAMKQWKEARPRPVSTLEQHH